MITGLIQQGIDGAKTILKATEDIYQHSLDEKGEQTSVGFPDTAYYLPLAYGFLGVEAACVRDVSGILVAAKTLLEEKTSGNTDQALDAGMAALICAEIIAAIRYLNNEEPQQDCTGFFTDSILRSLGLKLAGGKIPGCALLIGAAPDTFSAARLVQDFQRKNILTFVGGDCSGVSLIDQLKEEGIEMGWEHYLVPYGRDIISIIFPVHWAIRVALTFGAVQKGDRESLLQYTREKVPAVGVKLGELTSEEVAAVWGVINMGVPVVVNSEMQKIELPEICKYEALAGEADISKIPEAALQIRGIKTKISEIPVPVSYSAAFEGERVRKEEMFVQFGGNYSTSLECITSKDLNEIEDGNIEIEGREITKMSEGEAYPLALWIEVAGRKMEKDFEPVLERQIHGYLNHAQGIFHLGQRDMNWIRLSKAAQKRGFRLHHLGVILHARLHEDFGNILDKVRITISTEKETVETLLNRARKTYHARDERTAGMTDEAVDEFYSCTLCQSFAPHHVCIVKPERLGLCGAYNWLDCKVSYEINPVGPNQPVLKGDCIDPEQGEWEGVNNAVREKSGKRIERFHAYSCMTFPETSCGCFECIVCFIPEVNGFMAIHRQYQGMTPAGMTFTTLAGIIGGGQQTPGFIGVGRLYLLSNKFLKADGGIKRIVWMNRELKEFLGQRFRKRCTEEGVPDLMDIIAGEETTTNPDELMDFLRTAKHPVLTMNPLM
ncbi:MAG: CO dehydrogenase/CO-methylating acetyl-CoA synthase complex subunit beta [Nitrospiraceae bacterium]|nr:MAG: CO dehydrogenase/CO-methylating acetyl-CoA synthase complex subunit beta [Nitrospiraceae bacterium]